jgi:cytochrome P450
MFVSLQAYATIHAAKQFDWILPILMRCIPASVDKKRIEHYEFGNSKAERRIAKGFDTDRKDFLTYILKYNDTKYGLSEAEMTSNAGLFVFAGSETTATLLSGTTYYLLRNPEKMEKLVKEVRGAFKSEKDINFQSVSELKYLVACLEEGLRIYPPVPTGLPRRVPKGGDTVAGKFVPEGVCNPSALPSSLISMLMFQQTAVSVTHLGTFHLASNFQDPKSYVPERWTGEDPKYDSDNKSAVQPFSLGPRNCIGQQ